MRTRWGAVMAACALLCGAGAACRGAPNTVRPWSPAPDAAAVDMLLPDSAVDLGSADQGGAAPAHWHVARGFIRDAFGRAVIMRGVNLSSRHKTKPYFSFHQQADFSRVRQEWGFNAVRFLVSWSAVEPAKGAHDNTYLHQLARRMEWARAAGLLVVVDMHQDVYGEGFGGNGAPRWTCDEARYKAHKPASPWFLNYSSPPVMACFDRLYTDATLQQHYADAWRKVARRLQGFDNIVGFDVINEPHWGTYDIYAFERERLQPMYDRVVKAVRSEAPRWVAFLEPANSRNMGVATSLEPFDYPHTVYAPHSYDPLAEQGKGFSPSNRKLLVDNILGLASEAADLRSALWIGEYGGSQDAPGITRYMDAQYDGAGAVAASTMYWAYDRDGGYGLLYPDGTEKKKLLAALIRPYPERVAGDPLSYAFDETSGSFTLRYRPRAGITAPTVIVLPARLYPGAIKVSCGGCSTSRSGELLRVTKPPAGDPVTVVISPA